MICEKCGHGLEDGSVFCARCGVRQPGEADRNQVRCQHCGRDNPVGCNYCHFCGTSSLGNTSVRCSNQSSPASTVLAESGQEASGSSHVSNDLPPLAIIALASLLCLAGSFLPWRYVTILQTTFAQGGTMWDISFFFIFLAIGGFLTIPFHRRDVPPVATALVVIVVGLLALVLGMNQISVTRAYTGTSGIGFGLYLIVIAGLAYIFSGVWLLRNARA